jgi:hypothetical protein
VKLKLISIILFALVMGAVAQTEMQKPVTIGVLSVAGPHRTLANNITALLAVNLSADARFVVVDRSELDKVLDEQALGESGYITPDTAAKIGRLTGAKVLVAGREFNAGNTNIVVVASVIGTETGRVFSKTVQGSRVNLVELISDLSQKIVQTIVEQFTNFIAGTPVSREDRIAQIIKNINGGQRRRFPSKSTNKCPAIRPLIKLRK